MSDFEQQARYPTTAPQRKLSRRFGACVVALVLVVAVSKLLLNPRSLPNHRDVQGMTVRLWNLDGFQEDPIADFRIPSGAWRALLESFKPAQRVRRRPFVAPEGEISISLRSGQTWTLYFHRGWEGRTERTILFISYFGGRMRFFEGGSIQELDERLLRIQEKQRRQL